MLTSVLVSTLFSLKSTKMAKYTATTKEAIPPFISGLIHLLSKETLSRCRSTTTAAMHQITSLYLGCTKDVSEVDEGETWPSAKTERAMLGGSHII